MDKDLAQGVSGGTPCCSSNPVKQLDDVQRMASVLEHEIEDAAKEATGEEAGDSPVEIEKLDIDDNEVQEVADEENATELDSLEAAEEAQRLHQMGLNTAIAIGLHNFPEGACK